MLPRSGSTPWATTTSTRRVREDLRGHPVNERIRRVPVYATVVLTALATLALAPAWVPRIPGETA